MGIVERKLREKKARIRQIRKSALYLFEKKGFQRTTMEEIAARAEISKKTIYLYFRSKEDLFYDLVQERFTNFKKDLIKICETEIEPEKAIRSIFERMFNWYIENPEIYHFVTRFRANEMSKRLSPEKVGHLQDLMRSNMKCLAMVIKSGIEQGKFESRDPDRESVLFWNMFMGIILFQENRLDAGKKDFRKSTVDDGVDRLLRALRKV